MSLYPPRSLASALLATALALVFSEPALSQDLIVSANDGKYLRVKGENTYPAGAPSDSLAIIDAGVFPPVLKAVVEGVEHSVAGPPQAVAITPNAELAIVSGPSHYDYVGKKETFGTFLQPVDLAVLPPKVLSRVDIGGHPNGLAINREGTLLLAATLEGSVKVLTISGTVLRLIDTLDVCPGRLSGVSFTHDGKSAIVACRDFGGATILDVNGSKVTVTKERVSTGVGPYTIDVSSEGGLAVIGGAGIAALANSTSASDLDSVALVDVSKRPFRTVQFLDVPATPEDAAISPNGKWIVVQSLNGSNVPAGSPGVGRREKNKITLFAVKGGRAEQVDQIDGGEAGQGIVFAGDSKTIISQNNVERELVVLQVVDGKLVENGRRIAIAAGPSSIRAAPR